MARNARRRVARAAQTFQAHQRLLKAVLAGELRECPWEVLKAVYLGGSSDRVCIDRLASWSREHGIEIQAEQRRAIAGGRATAYNVVKFKRPN